MTVKERINLYNPSDLDGRRVEFLISFPQEPKGSLGTVVGKRVDHYAIQVDGTPQHCKTVLARDQFRLIERGNHE